MFIHPSQNIEVNEWKRWFDEGNKSTDRCQGLVHANLGLTISKVRCENEANMMTNLYIQHKAN